MKTSTYKLEKFLDSRARKYAIVSHCWLEEKDGDEIRFQTLDQADVLNLRDQRPALRKLRGACQIVRQRSPPLEWLWIDTCCIDKENSNEETESINSMFTWSKDAAVCYVYLDDVRKLASGQTNFESQYLDRKGQKARWLSRGWTLQELLASRNLEFYDCAWNYLGTDRDLAPVLQKITGIQETYLTNPDRILEPSIATRMSWMAGRSTTRVEDIAYSMLGILNVHMEALYGEGRRAFVRLQTVLLASSPDESLFAWTWPRHGLRCFPGPRPDYPVEQWKPQSWG